MSAASKSAASSEMGFHMRNVCSWEAVVETHADPPSPNNLLSAVFISSLK